MTVFCQQILLKDQTNNEYIVLTSIACEAKELCSLFLELIVVQKLLKPNEFFHPAAGKYSLEQQMCYSMAENSPQPNRNLLLIESCLLKTTVPSCFKKRLFSFWKNKTIKTEKN